MDWDKVKSEYIAGGTSYRKLAEKYGVSFSSVRWHADNEKWTDLKAKAQQKADTKIVEKIGGQKASRSAKLSTVADKLLDKIQDLLETMPVLDTQSVKHLTSALKDLKEVKGIKSDIDLREQEARINKLQREADRDQDDNNKVISITIEGGNESWRR